MRLRTIALLLSLTTPAAAQTVVNIDASKDRHRINPNVYGTNLATQAEVADLNAPLNRLGGNHTTRYNWQQNCTNRARDWFFQTIEDGPAVAAEETDSFITASRNGGSQPMMTVGILGWVAKMGPNRTRTWSYPRQKFPNQQQFDLPWWPDSGNGFYPDGSPIPGADPNDANMPVDHNFMRGWIQHNVAQFGASATGGVRYYILDNEYSIWQSTHRDVQPQGANYEEVFSKMNNTARMIKEVDPNALVAGPEEWGWSGYFWSAYDIEWAAAHGEWTNTPDRVAHGGLQYMPFILQRFYNEEKNTGKRLLDIFTLHYYPQSGEYSDWYEGIQEMRNRSTRSLWDPNYTDESWIGDKVNLIARMRDWVDRYYPGTPIGLTEYSWGADGYIGGATAQADIFGILGRENIDLATRWVTPAASTPTYKAMKMYRNYDGNKSTFGDISVRATVPNPDTVSAFASIRTSDRAMTVMLINKQLGVNATTTVNLANFAASGAAQRWQLTSSNAITAMAPVTIANGSLSVTLPAQSITLLVIPGGTADVIDPALNLTAETVTDAGIWTFTGTASDASGIARVSYKVAGGQSGDATGTASWSVTGLRLSQGYNYITFTAWDGAGNPTSLSKRIVYQSMGGRPPRQEKRRRPS
jgi:hypothetical protein